MKKDFVKWLVSYGENFELRFTGTINHELVVYRHKSQMITCDWHNVEKWFLYPFLLQRGIEGYNDYSQKHFKDSLFQYPSYIEYKQKPFYTDNGYDQAKEKALKYIWEQKK